MPRRLPLRVLLSVATKGTAAPLVSERLKLGTGIDNAKSAAFGATYGVVSG